MVLIGHKLKEVLGVADRVAVMRRGKLVAEAEVEVVHDSGHLEIGEHGGEEASGLAARDCAVIERQRQR